MNTQWIKNRSKEARWGAFNYLVPFTAVINIILLAALKFNLNGLSLYGFGIVLFSVFISISTVVGHLHGAKQQKTDALMENQAVIDEIVRKIVEKMEKAK